MNVEEGGRKKFLLRMSPSLWEELERWAARELRSVNGQIEFLLRRAVEERRQGRPGPARSQTSARDRED